MKLTENQIEQLFKFTRKHYVYHYDVQSELVDHVANDIENIWVEKPLLSFEDARDASFKKFGIFGFMDVIEAKQKQMNKRYRKILWRFFREWFTIPKIIITIGIFSAFFLLLQIQYSEYIFFTSLLFLIIFEMVAAYKLKKEHKKKEKKNKKIFLLETLIGTTKNGYIGIAFVNMFNFVNLTSFDFSALEVYWVFILSIVLTLLCILFYVSNYIIPEKAEELLQETYSEYKIVKNL